MPTLALVMLFAYYASAQQNTFFNPPNTQYGEIVHNYTLDDVWPLGSVQNITWSTSYTNSTLILWQNDNSNAEVFIESGPSPGFYNWNPITTAQNLANGAVFFFQVQDLSGSGQMFGSHYFNLTASSATSTTSSVAATSTTAAATIPTKAPTATETVPDSTQSSSTGMSGITKAGIGIGVGVGVPLIAAMGFGFFLLGRRRSRRYPPAYDKHKEMYAPMGRLQEMPADERQEMPARYEGYEMRTQYRGQELPGDDARVELPARHER